MKYAEAVKAAPPPPYDLRSDPKLKVVALDTAQQVSRHVTPNLNPPVTEDDLCRFVEEMLQAFRDSIEDTGVWRSLWDSPPTKHRGEKDAQRIFWTTARLLCKYADVDCTPEADEGVGPVDFKFSRGANKKALAEFKLAANSDFWNNIETKLPAYLKAAAIACGYFVVVQFEDRECTDEFKKRVRDVAASVAKKTGYKYKAVFVDARRKPSASNLVAPSRAPAPATKAAKKAAASAAEAGRSAARPKRQSAKPSAAAVSAKKSAGARKPTRKKLPPTN